MPTESELLLQSEFAAERLRSDIVSGAWSPGTKLKDRRIVGWSGPKSSAETAADEAIAKCKERGGTDSHIKAQWHDYLPLVR